MNIVVSVNKGNFFQFEYMQRLLGKLPVNHNVYLAIFPFSPTIMKKQFWDIVFLMGFYNLFAYQIRLKLNSFLHLMGVKKFRGQYVSMEAIADDFKVPYGNFETVNNIEFHKVLEFICPDVVINSCNQIYKMETISIPKIGIINTHIAKLPEYRSSMPVFWALLNEDKEFYITLHFIEAKIDSGKLVLRKGYVSTEKNLLKLVAFLNSKCADAVEEALEHIKSIDIHSLESLPFTNYKAFPSISDVRLFRKKGFKTGKIPIF